MWTSLSVSSWIVLHTLTIMFVFLASAGVDAEIHIKCCNPIRQRKIDSIKHCYNQTMRPGCQNSAYIIIDENHVRCVKPTPPWLKKLLQEGLKCPPDISPQMRRMFEVLDEDELE
ncbi:hypothetical protein PBY51_014062 [Eleginops maclovinus]|uniref:Chemokine interleukin-8-like domain-containing protein n=1 Tax=Eleginops maclovinus TaxID=56733 RepID=A0AAN7WUJ8_ELEMC|nr:hypothetical protein PBY51_014062 [Eleginops maclovinus]